MTIDSLSNWLPTKGQPLLIAGPCGAETPQQLINTAKLLQQHTSLSLFRAGIWKPRTRPNAFEGVGEEGLHWLKDVQQLGLKTTVEVANAQHTELALKHGVDVLWIGARTTVNPFSVQEIAEVLKGVDVPVMIKNPIHADVQLWLGAIERISNSGITKLAAIHRGFHVYGKTKYRNKPMWQLPIELRTVLPNLPIICDPSHISGKRELILSVAQKALDLGMNGLMIEAHENPDDALSDAQQQLTPENLGKLISQLVIRQESTQNPFLIDKLLAMRNAIDEIDEDMLNLLKRRTQVIEEMGLHKKEHHIQIFQLERWQEILRTRSQLAEKLGLSRQHIEKLCQLLHEESIKIQNDVMNRKMDEV